MSVGILEKVCGGRFGVGEALGSFYIKGLRGCEPSATELFALPATPVTRND